MDSDQIISLIGAFLLAFVVRFFNVVLEWLSKVLGVNAPDPIPSPGRIHREASTTPVADPPAPDVPPTG